MTEGKLSVDFTGRTWRTTVASAGEHRDREQSDREAARRTRKAEQTNNDANAVLEALDRLDPEAKGVGLNKVKDAAELSDRRMLRAVLGLREAGTVEEPSVPVLIGSGAERMVKGLRRTR